MFLPRYNTEEGFTLIELAVVVLIMGVLAAIAVPTYLNQRKTVLDSAVTADASNAGRLLIMEAMKGNKVTSVLTFTEDGMIGNAGTLNTAQIKAHSGTILIVQPSRVAGGVCIFGMNPDGKDSKVIPGIVLDSLAGGLISASGEDPVACADELGNLNVPLDAINAVYSTS